MSAEGVMLKGPAYQGEMMNSTGTQAFFFPYGIKTHTGAHTAPSFKILHI